jgi:hypothetical protein
MSETTWTWASEAERLAQTTTAADLGKVGVQSDAKTSWICVVADPPGWLSYDYNSVSGYATLSYEDEAARSAATVDAADVGKVALQQSDKTYWLLSKRSPKTWVQIDVQAPAPNLPILARCAVSAQSVGLNPGDRIDYDTKVDDPYAAVSTGPGWKFTCPTGKAGPYVVTVWTSFGDDLMPHHISLKKGLVVVGSFEVIKSRTMGFGAYLAEGETLTVTADGGTLLGGAAANHILIERKG